jgi:hypothetical protein
MKKGRNGIRGEGGGRRDQNLPAIFVANVVKPFYNEMFYSLKDTFEQKIQPITITKRLCCRQYF